MIPSMSTSMVLPPFVGDNPGVRAEMSPYVVTIKDVVQRFAISAERVAILKGLLAYRAALRNVGVLDGYQWLDGSFVEDVEKSRNRPPADIDMVTFARLPAMDANLKGAWVQANSNLFNPKSAKRDFLCDAYFVDLQKRPELLVDDTRYWFGMFSHQRETSLWKGMLQVPMQSNDDEANVELELLARNFSEAENAQEA